MTDGGLGKFDVARRQLDCAIRLFSVEDSIAVHCLAYHAYRLLRELLGADEQKVMYKLENDLELGKVPNFSKHVQGDPDAVLEEHSPKAVHLTIAIAIKLWERQGRAKTEAMAQFSAVPEPYKPGYQASYTLGVMREEGPITEEKRQRIITVASTGTPGIIRKKS